MSYIFIVGQIPMDQFRFKIRFYSNENENHLSHNLFVSESQSMEILFVRYNKRI